MWQRVKNIYHLGNAVLANLWFGFPSRHLTLIGVTGTDGKTTTTSLIYHILSASRRNSSMISSVGAIIGGEEYDVGFHVTTPSPWALQRFIKKSTICHPEFISGSNSSGFEMPKQVRHDKKPYLVLETTSHALDQYRVWGIKFDIGVLTNITHEHLDYHKTYEEYVKVKAKLLKMSRIAIVNRDDMSFSLISSKFKVQSSKFVTYGMKSNADIAPKNFPFKTNMIGEFNKYNILAAVAACRELGVTDNEIRKAIFSFKPVIGRQDIVYKNGFTVMIDFAHTPNAFEVILPSLRKMTKRSLIHVFGSAGERDRTKRPIMGKVSSKYADIIILTSEDPRSESAEKIIEEIASGIQNSKFKIMNDRKTVFKIADRKDAINFAINIAEKGDLVLTTGKSHEKSMNYGHGEVPWDEYEVVREALEDLGLKIKD